MKKTSILVIDDEESIGRLIKDCLERAGDYTVDTAQSAEQGYNCLRKKSYDMIFLDVLMPRVEGGEALATIKKISRAPIVVMSGYFPPEKFEAIRNAGAFSILEKPFSLEQALEAVQNALSAKTESRLEENRSDQ